MKCIICERWERTPYFRRHTTPTSAQDTEMALVLGFWLARRQEAVPKFCERHGVVFFQLDVLEDAHNGQKPAEPTEQQTAFLERAQEVTRRLSATPAPVPQGPPLALPADLMGGSAQPSPEPPPQVDVRIQQGQPSPAMEIVPPAPDKPSFPCPLCHRVVAQGEVHTC